jgi:endoglucanase
MNRNNSQEVHMNFYRLSALALICSMGIVACSSGSKHEAVAPPEEEEVAEPVAVDYSLGRAMNKRLGKGINLGNSWESKGYSDAAWGNPIDDNDFAVIKNAGFNSVRIPVRWNYDSDYSTHTVSAERLAGVKEDIQLALNQGLAVIVNFHHYEELNEAGNNYAKDPEAFNKEKEHFLLLWAQVAQEMQSFPDSMVVLEILNEPTIASAELVDGIMNDAYKVIRGISKKTIMFEAYHAAKFADLNMLHLPEDGNIIYSGHYYEPYGFSHQGHSAQYRCIGDAAYGSSAVYDLPSYVKQATALYPDINGGHIPMNMGEFGISGGDSANDRYCDADGVLPSARMKAQWAQKTVEAAEANDISWNYWGFTKVGGFEAYDRNEATWYEGFPAAFGL